MQHPALQHSLRLPQTHTVKKTERKKAVEEHSEREKKKKKKKKDKLVVAHYVENPFDFIIDPNGVIAQSVLNRTVSGIGGARSAAFAGPKPSV